MVEFVKPRVWLLYQSETDATVADPVEDPELLMKLIVLEAVKAAKFVPSA